MMMNPRQTGTRILLLCALALVAAVAAEAATPAQERQAILDHYAAQVRKTDPGFKGFSAAAGRAFFLAHPGTGRPATPSCTTCHTTNPHNPGRTRAGKTILPVAVSVTPSRFTRLHKVEKWFWRNCHTVYGRACTPLEKGNYITFMASQ